MKKFNFFRKLYKKIIDAGVYKASSIKVAEAAKVIEKHSKGFKYRFDE